VRLPPFLFSENSPAMICGQFYVKNCLALFPSTFDHVQLLHGFNAAGFA